MKQIISVFAIAGTILFSASCNTAADRERDAMIQSQQEQLQAMKIEMARKSVIDSMNAVATAKTEAEKALAVKTTTTKSYASNKSSAPSKVYTSNYSSGHGAAYVQPAVVQQPVIVQEQQKKGWSAKAKGAVIGTAVGAGAGAVINKRNRGAGAVIGAVLGAGAGTGIGAILDKKNGR